MSATLFSGNDSKQQFIQMLLATVELHLKSRTAEYDSSVRK